MNISCEIYLIIQFNFIDQVIFFCYCKQFFKIIITDVVFRFKYRLDQLNFIIFLTLHSHRINAILILIILLWSYTINSNKIKHANNYISPFIKEKTGALFGKISYTYFKKYVNILISQLWYKFYMLMTYAGCCYCTYH